MAWDLSVGPRLKRLLDQEEQGRDVPELLNRPALGHRTQWLMDAYDRLATERPIGFGAWGSIPHSKVVEEALRLGLGEDGLHELWEAVHRLDDQWREVANRPPDSTGKGAPGGRLPHQDHSRPERRGQRKPRSNP